MPGVLSYTNNPCLNITVEVNLNCVVTPFDLQRPVVSPQRVFKVVFLGNSGVGKTSFIRHCCTGHFSDTLSSTVGEAPWSDVTLFR